MINQVPNNQKPQTVDLNRYQNLDDVTMKRLETGLWFLKNKPLFVQVGIGALAAFGALTCLYALWGFGSYLMFGMQEDDRNILLMANTSGADHEYVKQMVARDLEVFSTSILESSTARGASSRFDFVTEVKNINPRHYGKISYAYLVNGVEYDAGEQFILPGGSKHLMLLGQEMSARPLSAQLILKKQEWKRPDGKIVNINNWQQFQDERLDIKVSDVKFTPPRASGLSEKLNLAQLDFSVTNNTAYNYWRAYLDILLYNHGQLVGVNRYSVDKLKSGEVRPIQISWPGTLVNLTKADVFPEIDIMDQSNYLKFEAGDNMPPTQ